MDWKQKDRSGEDLKLPPTRALWPVDLKLTHTDCSPGSTLVHFQGQYATICELDYNILQVEIQNAPKTTVSMDIGDLCLVEDISSRWYRGRVQNKSGNLFNVFLLDNGNILTVGLNSLSTISDSLLMLPPKIVSGYIANVLPVYECWDKPSEAYFSTLIGSHIKGYIHGLLPYKVLILEVPEITKELLRLSLGRHVDTDTFLLLVELTIEVPVQQSCESVPDLLMEKQIAQEMSFKSFNLCDYENILSLSGPKFVVGQKEKVQIAAAVKAGLFYCQLSSDAKDLKEMSKKLALVCESKKEDLRDKPGENMGLLCAIKGKDEKWHRGLVQCLPVNSQVRVVFVDYGYCETVKVENIFQLPPDFLLRPVMAFPCSLSCLGHKDQATINRQLMLLRKGLLGKELVVTVNDLYKEKNVCSVSLSNLDEYANTNMVQSKEVDQISSSGILTNMQGISKNLFNFEDIKNDSVFEGYIEHVQSPHDFWIRTAKSNDRFKGMMNKLTKQFSRLKLNEEILEDPVPGQLCCAMYEKDMHFYRARVVDILEYGAEVFFIDFGNTEKVPSMLIKKLPPEFCMEPEFAVGCSLAHVVPLEDVWTAAATDVFRKATANKALLVHVLYRRSNVFVVEMYEKGLEKSESIATLLTSANMAEYWMHSMVKRPGAHTEKNDKTGKTFARGRFTKNSCKGMSQTELSKVTKQEIATNKQAHAATQKYTAVDILKCQKFKPGAVIGVQCSHVSSPSDFWCQNNQNKNDLDRLMERLQKFYQTNTTVLPPRSVCCAVHLQLDKKWYRGCILGGTDLNTNVILVDYGKVVQEKVQNLQELNPEFLKLEGQAFRCSLYNLFDPVGGDVWSDEGITLLKDFTSRNSCNLQCKICSQVYVQNKGLYNVVELYTPFQQASAHLIEKGVAKKMHDPKQLLPSVSPCSFVYSSFDITAGSEELVFATHIVSPWEVYLQLDRNTEIIERLMERAMQESEELMGQMCTGKTGHVCLAKYSEDGKWYRSSVWPAQSGLHFNVFFVDYGGKQVAEKKNVLSIPLKAVDLLLTPMQALRCSLSSVPEEEHLPEVNMWLENAILNKGLRAKFVASNSSGHFICDLFDGDIHINERVREIFAIHGQKGKSVRKPASDCCKEAAKIAVNVSPVRNKFKARRRHCVKSVVKSQGTPGNTKGTHHVKPVFKSRTIQGRNKVVQGNGQNASSKLKTPQKSCNLNISAAKNGQATEKQNLKTTKQIEQEKCTISRTSYVQHFKPNLGDLPAIKITPGFRGIGFISHCNSVDSFFIQMEKDEQNILKMRKELNSRPFTEGLQSITSNLKVGDLVAARYHEDSSLYRAAVSSVASSGNLTVEFVDYGNTEAVDKKGIYTLASKFLFEARLSIQCKLSKPYNLEDVESFLSGTLDKPVMVEFVQNLGYAWEVSVQELDASHESRDSESPEGTKEKVADSGQPKEQQEFYATQHEPDASLESICEKIEAETNSSKEEIEKLQSEAKDSNVTEDKTLEKVQDSKATDCVQKLRQNRKACAYKHGQKQDVCQSDLLQKPEMHTTITENDVLTISNGSCGQFGATALKSSELPEIGEDNEQGFSQSVVHQPTSEQDCLALVAIPLEKPPGEDEIRRLCLAPVKKDHEYSGFAAAVTTPGEFYVVLEDLLLIMNAVSSVLEDLPEDLAPLPEAHLIPGTGCLVRSEEKKKWCRAEVIQHDDTSVVIDLVDYGYCVHLTRHDVCKLKALPVDLAGFPKITYPCLLRGIEPADGAQWSDQAAMFFQQCLYQKNLKIHFRQCVSEAQWEVDVVASNRNVAKELVDAGHAHYINNMLEQQFQQELDLKWGINSNYAENVSEAVSGKHDQTQSKMEPHGYLEDVSSGDDEDISKGETEDSFSGHKPGSTPRTYGLKSGLRHCVSGLQ